MVLSSSATDASTVTPPTRYSAASAFTVGSSAWFIHASAASGFCAVGGIAYESQKLKLPSSGMLVLIVLTPSAAAKLFIAAQPW